MTSQLRFATCVAAALTTFLIAGAILPDAASPLHKTQAQSTILSAVQAASNDADRVKLTALRDSFVEAVKSAGQKPSLDPPQIVFDSTPAFGRYDGGANLLHIASWSTIDPAGEARFTRLKALLNDPRSTEEIFDDSVHHWIFIHELAHWWQACQHKNDGERYAVEFGANRIAAAYWRMKDPAYMQKRTEHFQAIVNLIPNPLPGGQSKEQFFNEHFASIVATSAYSWFQSNMVVDVSAEKPLPTFQQTLQ